MCVLPALRMPEMIMCVSHACFRMALRIQRILVPIEFTVASWRFCTDGWAAGRTG